MTTDTTPDPLPEQRPEAEVGLSYVIIGFNEGDNLDACIASAREAAPPDTTFEIIYVDGGSSDDSLRIAQEAEADKVLGGDKRRRAAENRNLGLSAARGRYVQFVDGDMVIDPDWPTTAKTFLDEHPDAAVVYGELVEANKTAAFRALQLDWAPWFGEVAYCGGTAMARAEVLRDVGGFPEHVAAGEEPFMCWHIRNTRGMTIHHLQNKMADHDLGFRGFRDYWRRSVKTGSAYIEVASHFWKTDDPLWRSDTLSILAWAALMALIVLLLIVGPTNYVRGAVALVIVGVLTRKFLQFVRRGNPIDVCLIYAVHSYFVKIPLSIGVLSWLFRRSLRGARLAVRRKTG
jgi:glycosyltransferase involved in cell wall biosynthesis